MKDKIKNLITLAVIIMIVLLSFQVWYDYETSYKITFIERVESQDGRTAVIFQMRGGPGRSSFGKTDHSEERTKGRVIVERDGEEIKRQDFTVRSREEALTGENWEVQFYPAGVEIVLYDVLPDDVSGEETAGTAPDDGAGSAARYTRKLAETIPVYYDKDGFGGYSEEEIISWIVDRYDGQVSFLRTENDRYYFQADGFEFSAANDFHMTDDYEEAYLGYLAEQFSHAHNRAVSFEKGTGRNGEDVCVPVIDFYGRQTGESESFSNACCDLVEGLQETVEFEQIGYFEEEDRHYFDLTPYLENYSRTELYNALYVAIERDSLEVWQKKDAERTQSSPQENDGGGEESGQSAEESAPEFSEEMPEVWNNYDADCVYKKKDGSELCMVGVDRAAGSSYYVLLAAKDGVYTSVVNRDPYLGFGGGAKWLDFLEDERIGFSCLSYSGGSKGSLYRTADGGVSFEEVTWPSGEKKLPDGSLYNPFIMPEKVWEESGKLYMLVSQGPEGDYYEDGVWVYGLYESEDMGINWTYVGTQEGEDIRQLW